MPHARADEAQGATLSWADRFELFPDPAVRTRIAATRTSRLAGRVDPEATAAGLMLSTDWQTWLCLFDDAFCDETELDNGSAETIALVTSLLTVPEGGAAPVGDPNRFLAALADSSAVSTRSRPRRRAPGSAPG